MLYVPKRNNRMFDVASYGTTASSGTIISTGNGSKGSYVQLLSATAQEMGGFLLTVILQGYNGTTAEAHPLLLDIGVDPAGGTSYSAVITDLVCGDTPSDLTMCGSHKFLFPLRIPAGATVATRGQSDTTTRDVYISLKAYSPLMLPAGFPVGQHTETVGNTTFTPGSGSYGSWTSLGTSTHPYFWVQLGYQMNNTGGNERRTYVELAYGDTSNKHTLMRDWTHHRPDLDACGRLFDVNLILFNAYHRLPAGTEFFVRGASEGAPNTTHTANVVGVVT